MTPESFREDLKRFDKRLDFQFNKIKMEWEIFGIDRKNKKYVIKSIPIGKIDTIGPWVLQDLYECSPTKQGGHKELNRRIDEAQEKEELRKEVEYRDKMQAINEDAYLHLKHQIGQRVSFHKTETSDSGIVINDRRRLSTV